MCLLRRSISRDDLQPISVSEETGCILSGSLGKGKGSIRICREVSTALDRALEAMSRNVQFRFLVIQNFFKELKNPHQGGNGRDIFYAQGD